MNVLVVMADQLVPFMTSPYGDPVAQTPNMQRLADEGVRYDAAYTPYPLCSPARAAFMTGDYASKHGCYDNASILPADVPTVAHYLTLAGYYAGAELFVFPSIYEGFGFPLLEAMAHGVPSIAARSSSLPEIGGDAALYFEPGDARELQSLMERVLGDGTLRDELAARGRARAAQFRWDRAAEQTLGVLRAVSS